MKIRLFAGVAALLFCLSAYGADKKVLLVDSYHEGYPWSDGIVAGAKSILGDKAELQIFRMDTKNNPGEDFKKAAGEKAKAQIDSYKPDVVIACDDNASKYLVVPFLKDKDLPVVFCGINWDASGYGFPCDNVTGMIEVSVAPQMAQTLEKFAKGNRLAFLGVDNETSRKEAENTQTKLGLKFTEQVFAATFEDWKKAFLDLQSKVDIIFIENNAGIKDWDDAAAKKLTRESTTIPTGSIYDWMAPYVMISYAKSASEQGEWAAGAALRIIGGEKPKDIAVAKNEKGELYVNIPIATKLGVQIPLNILKSAKKITE